MQITDKQEQKIASFDAVVLAAGKGTRMGGEKSKLLHQIWGANILELTLWQVFGAEPRSVCVVVGRGELGESVFRAALHAHEKYFLQCGSGDCAHAAPLHGANPSFAQCSAPPALRPALQGACGGTAAAFLAAAGLLLGQAGGILPATPPSNSPHIPHSAAAAADAGACAGRGAPLLALCGDMPCISSHSIRSLMYTLEKEELDVCVLTGILQNPSNYGKIVRDTAGNLIKIVEHRDATQKERKIREVSAGVWAFSAKFAKFLQDNKEFLSTQNAQKEAYLTKAVEIAKANGFSVGTCACNGESEIAGINTHIDLASVRSRFRDIILNHHMLRGVEIVDPASTFIDFSSSIEQGAVILPRTTIEGSSTVHKGAIIGPDTYLKNVTVHPNATVRKSDVMDAVILQNAQIGPFSYIRPASSPKQGSHIGIDVKIGAFVEVKNSTFLSGSKAPHLSYIGDASIGENTNIGAGVVFANYDGKKKHQTIVDKNVQIGANSTLVAPVHIKENARTGAGTTVRSDIPPGVLCVGCGTQRHIQNTHSQKSKKHK